MKEEEDIGIAKNPDRSAGVPPAVAGASRPRFGEVTIRSRGRLPHWESESATYFITFRLADSLPKSVLDRIETERHNILQTANQMHRPLSAQERKRIQLLSGPIIEDYLDKGEGACHLRNPAVADEVASVLQHFNEKRYRPFAWCVMPNHVHIVFRMFPGHTLADVVHSWKSFSAKAANRLLGLHGALWQREYYDHLIRNEGDFDHALEYVAENPSKAKLTAWKCVWVCGRDARTTAAEDGGATKPVVP